MSFSSIDPIMYFSCQAGAWGERIDFVSFNTDQWSLATDNCLIVDFEANLPAQAKACGYLKSFKF
jgi:hypothetical protein